MCNAGDQGSIPGSGRSLEKETATHSSILAWRVPWTEEPCGLQSMGSRRIRHDWVTNTFTFLTCVITNTCYICMHMWLYWYTHTHTHTYVCIMCNFVAMPQKTGGWSISYLPIGNWSEVKVAQSCLDLHSPWNSPGQNTKVGSCSLLQDIFPTQGSNSGLLHCRQILYSWATRKARKVFFIKKSPLLPSISTRWVASSTHIWSENFLGSLLRKTLPHSDS